MRLYCNKCHCILQVDEFKCLEAYTEQILQCPECKYKVVVWRKKD